MTYVQADLSLHGVQMPSGCFVLFFMVRIKFFLSFFRKKTDDDVCFYQLEPEGNLTKKKKKQLCVIKPLRLRNNFDFCSRALYTFEPRHEKTNVFHMRNQRRRSASRSPRS